MKMVAGNENNSHVRDQSIYLHAIWIAVLLFFIVAAVSIPFLYPSMTLWYKTGIQRFLLVAGKISGILATSLLFVQIAMIGLPMAFSRKTLIRFHRINGTTIGLLAVLHPLLVLGSNGFQSIDLLWTYWPETMGGVLLLVIGFNTIASSWRPLFKVSYQVWKTVHRIVALAAIILIPLHVLFISSSFTKGPPRYGVLIASGVVLIVWVLLIAGVLPIKKRAVNS